MIICHRNAVGNDWLVGGSDNCRLEMEHMLLCNDTTVATGHSPPHHRWGQTFRLISLVVIIIDMLPVIPNTVTSNQLVQTNVSSQHCRILYVNVGQCWQASVGTR